MNSIVFVFLFGIVFGVQAQIQYRLFNDAESLKNHVISITNDLANFEKSFTFNFIVELSKQKILHLEAVIHAMNFELRELDRATRASWARGIDVLHCYRSAQLYLESKSKIAFGVFDKCASGQTAFINSLLANIQNHLKTDTSILQYLNSVVLLCSSGTQVQVAPCVSSRLPAAKASIAKYQAPVSHFKAVAGSLLPASAANHYQCALPAINSFKIEIQNARAAYNKCIWNRG